MKNLLKVSEHAICNSIVELLNYQGHYVWRTNAGMLPLSYTDKTGRTRKRMVNIGRKGTSDIIGLRKKDGRMLALEVKTPERRNQATEAQLLFLADIKNFGGIAGIVTNPEEALKLVEAK